MANEQEDSKVIDRKRAWLIPYLQGWIWKLDECCSGAHVHPKAQPRQSLLSWVEILQSPLCTLEQVLKIERMVPEVVNEARRIYRQHLDWKTAERINAQLKERNGD